MAILVLSKDNLVLNKWCLVKLIIFIIAMLSIDAEGKDVIWYQDQGFQAGISFPCNWITVAISNLWIGESLLRGQYKIGW